MKKKNEKFLESALLAKYFGFEIHKPYEVTREDVRTVKDNQKETDYVDDNFFIMEEIISILRNYKEETGKDIIEPKLLYIEGQAPGPHKKKRKKINENIINLHIVNVSKSIADATLIKTAEVVLADSGIKNICIKINSIGGKEAQSAFIREATNYYRKNLNSMTPTCRQLFKSGIYNLIKKGCNKCSLIHEEAPKTMDFLGDDSRKHFSEVIEFLENLNINYEIDQFAIGDPNYSSHTIFEIIDLDTDKIVAAGCRYNLLYKKIGTRKEIPAVGITINLPSQKTTTARSLKKVNESKVYFMQIGYEAKLNSLRIIDDLRKQKIALKHRLYRDRLSNQISAAKKSSSEYIVIIGQKEALEGTAILRDKESKSQSVVDVQELPNLLKKIV